MIDVLDIMALEEKRDRRSGLDRRFLAFDIYLPERRTGKERRIGDDRRKRTLHVEKKSNGTRATS